MPRKKFQCRICGRFSTSEKKDPKMCSRACAQKFAARSPAKKAYFDRIRGTGKSGGYVKRNGRHEHRVVAEEILGRKLRKGETVHHVNGVKSDNRRENIVVLRNQGEHARLHSTGRRHTSESIKKMRRAASLRQRDLGTQRFAVRKESGRT